MRPAPSCDLLGELVAGREEGDRLPEDELNSTAILPLNVGHEATVHAVGNGAAALLARGLRAEESDPDRLAEEVLRLDPPLHLFTRYAKAEAEAFGPRFAPGDPVGCLLASANRDSEAHEAPDRFGPKREPRIHAAFHAGIHFCVGVSLARLALRLAEPSRFAATYHSRGLERLMVAR